MDIFKAIRAFVLKSRPAYKDYIGDGQYEIKKLPDECVPDSVTKGISKAQSTADAAQSTANAARSTANAARSTANAAQSTADAAVYNGTRLDLVSMLDASLYNYVSFNINNHYIGVGDDGCGLYKYVAYNSSDEKLFEVCLLSNKILKVETGNFEVVDETYTEKQTLLDYWTYVPSLLSDTTYRMVFNVYRYSNSSGKAAMRMEFSKCSDIARMGIYCGRYDPTKKLQFGAQTMADSTTLGLIRAPEAHDTDTLPVRIKSSEGTLWVEDTKEIPDWNQNSSSANDYIKNRPCYAVKTPNWSIIQQGKIEYALANVSGGTYPTLYDQAMDFMGDVKGEFKIMIHNEDYSSVYNENLSVMLDDTSVGKREYKTKDGKVAIQRTVASTTTTLTFDESFVGQTYTLSLNAPGLTYYPLDDGYIPATIQRVGGDVIISSSTSGSAKKFKLTVDDAGTISASEVTT